MIYIGTSGFKYPEWKGKFYPAKIKPDEMLPFYAARFNTTEVNYTYYRMPTVQLLRAWREQVQRDFKFSFKAPQRITHIAQLRNCEDITLDFIRICEDLDQQLGVLLFQLPASFQKDVSALENFVSILPEHARVAFEFRHPSWFSDDVYDTLRHKNVALCIADSEKLSTPLVMTADFAYFRLRDEGYDISHIDRWATEIVKCKGEVFVYFKHEEKALGPEFAQMLIDKTTGRAVAQEP